MRATVQKLLFGLVVFSAGLSAERSDDTTLDQLPEGEAKHVLVSACVGCHDLATTLNARKTLAEWEATVYDMMSRGAQVFPDEVDMLVQYLEENLGQECNPDTRH